MHEIIWSNGHLDRARTWQGLMDIVRTTQWHDYDEEEFRAAMGKRAWRWAGAHIDIGATPKRFFEELERAKMIYIYRPEKEES